MRLVAALSLVLLLGVLGSECIEHRHGLGRSREIILHNRVIDTTSEEATTDFSREGAEYFYVTFKLNFAGNKVNVDKFAEDYGVVFDSYFPMTTYTVYTSYAKAEAISQNDQVLWLGVVPASDKVPTGLEGVSLLVLHWSTAAAEFPSIPEVAADVAARMQQEFPADSFAFSEFNTESNTVKLQINDESSFRKMVSWLLNKGSPRIKFVDPMPVNKPSGAYATHVVVDGTYNLATPAAASCAGTANTSICPYETYLNYGASATVTLDGTGEVITIVDSGVDANNCLFYDPNFQFDTYNADNRKIVYYVSNTGKGGNTLDETGHGSFAVGLAAAAAGGTSSSYSDADVQANSGFNGVAPGAKIAVSDVQTTSANSLSFDYTNIGAGYLDPMYAINSRIGLFPWGAEINLAGHKAFYSAQDQAFDKYASSVPDFLLIAPVGNNGLFTVPGTGRIDSPASAKNVLAVGGSLNSHYSFMFSDYVDLTAQAEDLHTELCTIGDFSAYYSTVLCTISGQSSPCTNFQNVLCFGAFKEPTPEACCAAAYTKPQCCPETVLGLWSASYSLFSESSGYPQSSRGPTYDYRIKPDIVAPAQRLYSAGSSPGGSNPYCGTWTDTIEPITSNSVTSQAATVSEGTSFAAGVAAGAAALIRQYLRQGFYPYGDPSISGSQVFQDPSAALIRAIMVNGAETLFQYNANNDAAWKVLSDYLFPEIQGHGRINLANSLSIEPTNIVTTILIDGDTIPYTNATNKYYFAVSQDATFIKVTVVWTDPAAAVGAGHALVNNLDVVLIRDDGFEYRANRLSEFDYNNNVEHIYAPAPASRGGTYSVAVHGAYVPSGPQNYALVISGQILCPQALAGGAGYDAAKCLITDTDVFANAKCPMDCSLRLDGCVAGVCYCSPPYYGVDCSLTPCPNNCNNNGVCDGETGTCTCNDFWTGTDCSQANPSGNSTNCIYNCPVCGGVNIGITIGVSIGAFLLGLLIAFPFGVWLATHLMLKRKKKMFAKMRAAQQHAQQAQPLHENIEHDSDDE